MTPGNAAPDRPAIRPPSGARDRAVFLCVAGFFLCCYLRVLTTGYLELDDLGRVQIGYMLWAEDGRLLTAALMALLSFGGRMVDLSPLPQLGAIALTGAAGVLMARAAPELPVGRVAAAAALLFATPFYLQNMSYVFDSLSMGAAVVLALAASLSLQAGRGLPMAVAALLASLMFYQAAICVFVCFAAGAVLFELGQDGRPGSPAAPGRLAAGSLLVLLCASALDLGIVALSRAGGLVTFPAYQARHAALPGLRELAPCVRANLQAMLGLVARMVPPSGAYGLLMLSAPALLLALALYRLRRSRASAGRLALSGAAALVLLTGFGGPMLLLREPVVQPRTLIGVGAMLSASCLFAMRMLPAGRPARLPVLLAGLLLACFARDAFAYGALLRDLDRYEASVLPAVARQLDDVRASTGLTRLQILGAMPYPAVVRQGLLRAPGLAPLFDNPLNGISWFGVALLWQYGLDDGIVFRDPGPAALCRAYRETGPGYGVGHDDRSLVLVFRGGCAP